MIAQPLPMPMPHFDTRSFGVLMPMFLWVTPEGDIRAVGRTLAKVLGPDCASGDRFDRHFVLRRFVHEGDGMASDSLLGLLAHHGAGRLNLDLACHPDLSLRGSSFGLGDEGVIIDLTFGIQIGHAVQIFGLTETDFSASDLALELLYLGEANATVLGELGQLTARLEVARRTAVVQALTDPLTGLANRRAFDAALAAEFAAQDQGGAGFAIAHIDLDYFKDVNDTFGHAAGDRVLAIVGERLERELRRTDLVARTGGDEFLLLLRGVTDPERLHSLGARLIAQIEEPYSLDHPVAGILCRISASVGFETSLGYDSATLADFLEAADRSLYAAKRGGRGRTMAARRRGENPAPEDEATDDS